MRTGGRGGYTFGCMHSQRNDGSTLSAFILSRDVIKAFQKHFVAKPRTQNQFSTVLSENDTGIYPEDNDEGEDFVECAESTYQGKSPVTSSHTCAVSSYPSF